MTDQKLTFTLEGPEGRLDEITFQAADGAILQDVTSTRRHSPSVTVSQLIAVRIEDSDAEGFDPQAFVLGIPSHRRGVVVRYIVRAAKEAAERRARLTAVNPDNDD